MKLERVTVVVDRGAGSGAPVTAPLLQVRHLTAWPTAVVREAVRRDALTRWSASASALVRAALAEAPAGPPFTRFLTGGPLVTVETGYPVHVAVPDLGVVIGSGLPAGTAVVAVVHGPLGVAYDALAAWLDEHGYSEAAPHWEVYLPDRTEVVVPYRVD